MEIVDPKQLEQDPPLHQRHSAYSKDTSRDMALARPAGFIRRAISYTIDMSVIFILFLFFIYWGLMGMRFSGGLSLFFDSASESLFALSFVFLYTGYFTFFHAYGGQTPAKMILRIIVVNKQGVPPSYFRALMRSLGLFFSHLFFGFGFLLAIIEPKKRALHDLLTGTQVMLAP